jgi:hypothetical protein
VWTPSTIMTMGTTTCSRPSSISTRVFAPGVMLRVIFWNWPLVTAASFRINTDGARAKGLAGLLVNERARL